MTFPKWHQPDPAIGAVLVNSQDELDKLVASGWPNVPMAAPAPSPEMLAMAARIKELEAMIAAAPVAVPVVGSTGTAVVPPSVPTPPAAAPVPTPPAASPAATTKK